MLIEPIIGRVDDGDRAPRPIGGLKGLMIHRCGLDHQTGVVLGYDAESICAHFSGRDQTYPEVARATGDEVPYSIMIGGDCGPLDLDGRVWQTLGLDDTGPHGRRWASPRYIGIACIGDFRERYRRPPSQRQLASLISLCASLALDLGLTVDQIVGHGDVRSAHNGSKAPGQPAACPGDLLDLRALRSQIADEMALVGRAAAHGRLLAAGLVYPG